MNEVTRIHLGRQPFTIAADAHKALKAYLADIEAQVGDKSADVVKEVEARMAELLSERGIDSDKAILTEDVDFLKEQLGDPQDFKDEATETDSQAAKGTSRRLFRDTDNALVAGVAAGLANYFGLDVVLVRLAVVILIIVSGGTGLIVYALMWLVVPPAHSTSEKLQMQGKPVTLGALKDSVSKADVTGTARRLNSSLLSFIDGVFRVLVKLVGIGFICFGLLLMAGIGVAKTYMLLHGDKLFQENLFPVGAREHWLLGIAMLLGVIVAVFLILVGLATFQKKWPIRGWITAILVGLFMVGSVAGLALGADAAPRIRDRYEATLHTTAIQNITPFSKVVADGIDITYIASPDYAVNLHYSGNPDLSKIKVSVHDNTLYVDAHSLTDGEHCTMLCLFPKYDLTVQVYAPNIQDFKTSPRTEIFYPNVPPLPAKPAQP